MNASPIIPYFQLWAQSVFGSIGLSNLNTCRGNPGRQMTVGFGCIDQWWMQSSVRLREVVSTVNLYCTSTMLGDLGETKLELVPCGCIVGDSCANRWPWMKSLSHYAFSREKQKANRSLPVWLINNTDSLSAVKLCLISNMEFYNNVTRFISYMLKLLMIPLMREVLCF